MNKKQMILELRKQGLTYDQIVEKTGCSKGTIAYHCNPVCKTKSLQRTQKRRKTNHPLVNKLETFKYQKTQYITKILSETKHSLNRKLCGYLRRKKEGRYIKAGDKREHNFLITDVLEKIGPNPKCYLTGKDIDLQNYRSYQLDHIVPVSKGGPNSLENMGLCTTEANQAKKDMLLEDFIDLCKQILQHNGYTITKNTQT